MKKRFTTAALLMGLAGFAQADIFEIGVSADTYIRNDSGGPNSKNDGDADNEIIIGTNGSFAAELNGLLRFDLSSILALGSPGGITINSVTLTGTTRGGSNGAGADLDIDVYDYGFEFVEADATYNDPDGDGAAGTGDTTAGGTNGTLLTSSGAFNPVPQGTTVVFGDSANFQNAVSTQLAGDGTLNLLLRGSGSLVQTFARFDNEDRANPFKLTIDATGAPLAPGNLFEDFESSSAGSSSPPSGWVLVDTAGPVDASYATSSAGAGSNGAGGNAGLAGRVTSPADFLNAEISGAYLYNTTNFDMRQALTGSFDFQAVSDSTFDDITFMIGAIADGVDVSSAGELLSVKIAETGNPSATLNSGLGQSDRLDTSTTAITDDTWYHAELTWTPTSATTGDFVITVSDFSGDLFTLTTTGFTFDNATAQIGFGSVNDVILFDNVNFNQIPEPGSLALLGLGGLLFTRRRR